MLDISNAVHALNFSALTVFAWVGNPNLLWVPQDLVFVRRNDVIYGGPGFDIVYAHTWPLGISWGSEGHDTVDHCLRLKCRTSMTKSSSSAFVEVWRILVLFCSGRLAYKWQWWIGYILQSTIFHNVYCPSCKCYISQSCLMLHYQRRTDIYCINSLAICKEVPLPRYWYFSLVFTNRVSSALLSR